jgi:hypothetical protein
MINIQKKNCISSAAEFLLILPRKVKTLYLTMQTLDFIPFCSSTSALYVSGKEGIQWAGIETSDTIYETLQQS